MTTKMQQDRIEQLIWRLKSLPVRVGSRVAPGVMTRNIAGARRVHLGCGGNILPGWANLDVDGPEGVTRFDLGRPLPFASGSVDLIYTEHFIEHVRKEAAASLLQECARILKPGGILRISTPDLAKVVREYQLGRVTEWLDMQYAPETPCDMVNESMRLWGHQYIWDEAELRRALAAAGFDSVRRMPWGKSDHGELVAVESRPDHSDLIVEATR